jgi:beta-lactam-binding protein with PASTA domain
MTAEARRMPTLWHLSAEDALATLHAAGMAHAVHRAPNLVVPSGALVAVSPRPGAVLTAESKVIVTISSGPPRRPTGDADG